MSLDQPLVFVSHGIGGLLTKAVRMPQMTSNVSVSHHHLGSEFGKPQSFPICGTILGSSQTSTLFLRRSNGSHIY